MTAGAARNAALTCTANSALQPVMASAEVAVAGGFCAWTRPHAADPLVCGSINARGLISWATLKKRLYESHCMNVD